MRPALVVFDLAGTTVYDPDGVAGCLQAALSARGIDLPLADVNRQMGIAKPVAIATLLRQAGVEPKPEEVNGIHQDFVAQMLRFYQTHPDVREMPGASQLFAKLRQAGIYVGLDTGFSRDITDAIFQRLGWLKGQMFDASKCSDEVENGRPAPDLIFAIMKDLNLKDTKQVAKVGDTASDLGEGTSAGCGWVIGVCSGAYTEEQLQSHPHTAIVPSIADLVALWNL